VSRVDPGEAGTSPAGLFEQFLEFTPDAIVGIGRDRRIVLANAQAEALFGFTRAELLGEAVELLVPERFRGVHPLYQDGYFATPRPSPLEAGIELRRKDATEFPAEIRLSAIETGDGLMAIAAIRDISERRAAEGATAYLAAIVNSSDDAIVGKSLDGTIVSWNTGAEHLYGYSAEEVIGRPDSLLVPPNRSEESDALLRQIAAGHAVERQETVRVRKDGRPLTMSLTVSPVRDGRDRIVGAATIARDITDRVVADREKEALRAELEASRHLKAAHEKDGLVVQLNQLRRLESVGQLAGGIAHDFNNILGVILNYAQFVAEAVGEGSPVRDDVEEVIRAAERAAALTRQLLIFSRREVVRPEVLDLNVVVSELDRLLRRALGEHVELETRFAPDLARVDADPGQLEQVLVNLAVNARDAMPSGGQLLIETANVELDDPHADLPPGPYVRLVVSDTGIGMTPAVVARVFEPFFSTKPKGEGTGLGLATVYGIVTEAGGSVRIYSEPEIGTTVTVHLPASAAAPPPASSERPQPARPRGRGETVLVVEDEESVRLLTERILTGAGYLVLAAPGGRVALESCTHADQPIDLMLTDVVMPEMLGPDLVERATAIRPGLRVLYMSGYIHQAVAQLGKLDREDIVLLEKPFTADALLTRVRQALDDGR
jgi:PAS domain S-box-containing protein